MTVNPRKLQAYGIPLKDVMMAIQRSNNDVGGSVVELAENELMVRSRAYLKSLEDLGKVPVGGAGMAAPGACRIFVERITLTCVIELPGSAEGRAWSSAPFPWKNFSRFARGVKISTN